MGKKINFLKKNTILNDIMSNKNIVVSNNEQFAYAIQKANDKKENYTISYNNADIDSSFPSIKALYQNKDRNWLPDNFSKDDYEINALRFNNYNSNSIQNNTYVKYNNTINDNSLIIDNSYNSLYYVQPDKLNLLSYSLTAKNGFNYDENNHTLYFNVDNKYIKSINNLLYYNYNNIRNASPDNTGVASIDDKYFDVKNNNNSYSNNTLTIIKEFKTEIFSTLNKIKNLYKECEVIYDTLEYFNTINNNREQLSLNGGRDNNVTYNSREIKFENPKLYYSNYEMGIDSLDLSNVDTLYVFDLENAEFNIGYNSVKNYDYLSNKVIFNTSENVNSSNKDLLKNKMSLTIAENEVTADISYNHYYKNIINSEDKYEGKYPIGTTYNINLNNTDKTVFDNGISILYNSSPYINVDQNIQTITIPYKKELNIRKVGGSFKKYFYTTPINKDEDNNVEYLFVSSYYETKPFCVPKNSFDYLKSNNTITDCFDLQYFSSYKPGNKYDEVNPVLNIYPNNYINDKYFDSDLIQYLNIEDDTNDIIRYIQISDINQIITNEEELSTCISKIRDIYLNSVKCLYFYKLRYNEAGEYFETIGDPNMLIFEEDIDSMLTFIARNNVKFIFTTNNQIIARNLEYSLDGITWNKFDNTQEDNEYYITEDSGVYTCITGRIENSNKILWKLELDNLLQDENLGVLDYLNSGNGIGRFSSIYDGTNTNPEKNKPKFEIFGNSMSLVYGENIKEQKIDDNGEEIVEYKTELVNKPNIFRGLFADSQIVSSRRLALPALTLAQSNCCYEGMFMNCTLMYDCPTLPATVLSERCYKSMFRGCTNLKSTPRLDAKIMRAECYKEMFMNCTNLMTPPNVTKKYFTGILPSTELNYGCYESMFEGCTNLYVMPQLVASIMKDNCYKRMFMGCISISSATNMPSIQTFAKSCFYFMFYGTKIIPHKDTSGIKINICQNLYFNAKTDDEQEKFVHNVQIGALQGLFGGTDINARYLEEFLPEIKINGVSYRYLNTFLNENDSDNNLGSYNNLGNECYLDMFRDSKINIAPVLPATKMKKGCYKQMFYNCGLLKLIPQLNIENSAEECCFRMFYKAGNDIQQSDDINKLQIVDINGSKLSKNDDTLAKNCYYEMFYDCNKLSNTPLYIGGNVAEKTSCYQMFMNCTSMTTPPERINIKTMNEQSCCRMFYDCSNIDYIPEMHVDTTAFECCREMFWHAGVATNGIDMKGDSRLSSNSDTLAENCYYQMFFESKINKGPAYIGGNESEKWSCYQMFMNCKSMTTPPQSINIKKMAYQSCYQMFYDCSNIHHIPEMHVDTTAFECCREMFWHAGVNTNDVDIYMKGDSRLSSNSDTLAENCYYQMFYESKIKEGPTYIGGNVAEKTSCYQMFMNCTSMTTPPESINIKAMNVKTCYRMFYNCIKLESIPKMNVNSSAEQCCEEMFLNGGNNYSGYITLSNITLVTGNNTLANKAFKKMFNGCVRIKNMSSVIIGSGNSLANLECCMDMFSGCTSLINMPILNSRVMAEKSYMNMFKGCNSLQMINNTLLPSTTLGVSCYESMFEGCTSLVSITNDSLTNPLLSASILKDRCYANMYKGCIGLVDAPVLPAERLVSQCYDHMFDGCSSLRSIVALFLDAPMNELNASPIKTDEAVANSTDQWVEGVYTYDENNNDRLDAWEDYTHNYSEYTGNEIEFSNLTNHEGDVVPNKIFIRNHAATWDVRNNIGVDGIPENWKIYNDNDSDYNNRLSPVFIFFYSDSNRNFEDYSKLIYGFNGDDCTSYIPKYDPNYISSVYYNSSTNKITSYPNNFCRRGYTFEGWKNEVNDTDPTGDILYINGEYSSISFTGQDQHYWAKWTPTKYPIEWYYFNTNNARDLYATTYGDYDSLISSHKPDAMTPINDPVPTHHYPYKDGYIFVGWNSQENQRTENFYRDVVNVDTNGNIINTSSNLVGYVGTENGQQVNENKFYAVWKYVVKWNLNTGGYYTTNDQTNTGYTQTYYYHDYLYGDDYASTLPNITPSNDGDYEFDGWADYDGPRANTIWRKNIPEHYTVIAPVNFYSVWKPAIYWYNHDGTVLLATIYGYYNDSVLNYKPSNPSRTGYIFMGWNTQPNQEIANIDNIKVGDPSNNKFYAAYKIIVFTVTYKIAGTVYEYINESNKTILQIQYNYGTTLGSKFTGSSLPIAYDTDELYANSQRWKIENGNEVNSNTEVLSDMTLIPISGEMIAHKIIWNVNYTGGTNPNSTRVPIGNSVNASPDISSGRENYTYTWNTAQNGSGTTITFPYTPTGNNPIIELYAIWTLKEYFRTTFNTRSYTYVAEISLGEHYYWDDNKLEYSEDEGLTWNKIDNSLVESVIIRKSIQSTPVSIIWRGNKSNTGSSSQLQITTSRSGGTCGGECNLSGYISSLVFGNDFASVNNVCNIIYNTNQLDGWDFSHFFNNSNAIGSAELLKLNLMGRYCYYSIFENCTSLTSAPVLPATTLAPYCYEYMFFNCRSLTTAPALPATTLASSCYYEMFRNCTGLISAPALPATTLATSCYEYMFNGCTSLISAPSILPATTLKDRCYLGMFYNCTSLTTAPELPATTLADSCYLMMFEGCTSLTTAPALPATTLEVGCYGSMFSGCTSLTTAPALPATTLVGHCYYYMFANCTHLTSAPVLPATTLVNKCYECMFTGCSSLNYIKALFITTPGTNYTDNWVNGVAESGIFIKNASATWNNEFNSSCIPLNNTHKWIVDTQEFTLTVLENGTTFKFTNAINYSLDYGVSWTLLTANTNTPLLNANTDILFKGTLTPTSSNGVGRFSSNKSFNALGNTMSLLYGDNYINQTSLSDKQYAFKELFYNNSYIKNAEYLILPATTLSEYCYNGMFSNCTSLTTAPELPAITLADYCYYFMFSSCTSLTTAPALPATTLADECYRNMFSSCTSLTTAPALPATTLAVNCYYYMFANCTSLTTAPALPATTLAERCYNSMFYDCTNLTSAPVLPATTLAESCYSGMFWGCTSLTSTPALPATSLAPYCYTDMFIDCTSLTTAPAILPATTLAESCYSHMFLNCTSLTTAPALPATSLADYCYWDMFKDCTSLTTAPALPATTLAESCYNCMFMGCTSLTTAPALPATSLANSCYWCMFMDCSSLNYIKALFITTPSTTYTNNWVYGVAESGTFVKNSAATWNNEFNSSCIPLNDTHRWIVEYDEIIWKDQYLTLTALEDNTTFAFKNGYINCSTDNGLSWFGVAGPNESQTIATINAGQTILFKGTENPTSSYGVGTFSSNKSFNASGNVMSLLYGDNFRNQTSLLGKNYVFSRLFDNSKVVDASNLVLPATTLTEYCYFSMFYGCTRLTLAPSILPATTLADYCYQHMFRNCSSLISAPELPATTLAKDCYCYMFFSTSLTSAPKLPATTLAASCYELMFASCSSLTSAPVLPATTLADSCYEEMFSECTSLTSAPELPATTLVNNCYRYMFYNCSQLNYIKAAFTTIPGSSYTTNWVLGVASSGTFEQVGNVTWETYGNDAIPTNWRLYRNGQSTVIEIYLQINVSQSTGTSSDWQNFLYNDPGLKAVYAQIGTTRVLLSSNPSPNYNFISGNLPGIIVDKRYVNQTINKFELYYYSGRNGQSRTYTCERIDSWPATLTYETINGYEVYNSTYELNI